MDCIIFWYDKFGENFWIIIFQKQETLESNMYIHSFEIVFGPKKFIHANTFERSFAKCKLFVLTKEMMPLKM